MDKKILCISGRKQAGKDTCYRFLQSLLTEGEMFPAMSPRIQQFYSVFIDWCRKVAYYQDGVPSS